MTLLPIFGRYVCYVWDTKLHKWIKVTRQEYRKQKAHGRDVMYLRLCKGEDLDARKEKLRSANTPNAC